MIEIKLVNKKNKKEFDMFDEKAWKKFNKERGYSWNKKK